MIDKDLAPKYSKELLRLHTEINEHDLCVMKTIHIYLN